MKEIVYETSREKVEIVEHDFYHDHEYYILNYGTHPCAYVENRTKVKDYDDERLFGIKVHCGFTFCDTLEHIKEQPSKKLYLGWDYAHWGDFLGCDILGGTGKHWTYEEVLAEVHSVIEQLEKIEKDN